MTLNLRSGDCYAPRRDDYCTMAAGTYYDPGCPTPLWTQFLATVTAGDAELQAYLRRVAGYALTGLTTEHALFFLYGTGANGKSVFVNTLAGVWGDYAAVVPTEVLMESSGDRHPTELARLRGIRLAIASETEQGRRWAESRIKSLTGGDKVAARFMRQDFFEFSPQFKLLVSGNHKPSLRGVDEAIRRRLHLVPFTVTIPPDQRDPDLFEKLKAEWPGIMAWAVNGCSEWQQRGLLPPPAVRAATDAYLDTQDALAAWMEENCDTDPDGWETRTALFTSWTRWTQNNGERAGTRTEFLDALETRGFQHAGRKGQRGFRGIELKRASYEDGP